MRRGEIWWANLPESHGGRRPVLIVQSNEFNESRIDTVIVAPLTTNLARGQAPGNVVLSRRESRLPFESVVNVSQIIAVLKRRLTGRVSLLRSMNGIDAGLRQVLALG